MTLTQEERIAVIKASVENSDKRKKQDFAKGRIKSKLKVETRNAVELLIKSGLDKKDAYDIVQRDTSEDHSIIGRMVSRLKDRKLRYTLETIGGGL